MKSLLANYGRRRTWRGLGPILPALLLPLMLVGVAVKPALDYGRLNSDLSLARERSGRADELQAFLAEFGQEGVPTDRYRQLEALLAARLPDAFEATAFYDDCLEASGSFELELDSIAPARSVDLGLPVAERSIHERMVTLRGRGPAADLPGFLAALHRLGRPVAVHSCRLHALRDLSGFFDFQLELGVYHLSLPATDKDEPLDS